MLITMCHAQIATQLFYAVVKIQEQKGNRLTVSTESGEQITFTPRATGFFVEEGKGELVGRRLLRRGKP